MKHHPTGDRPPTGQRKKQQVEEDNHDEIYSDESSSDKLSSLLTKKLNYDYSHITHVFSEIEGQSIQKFYNTIRIERVKELLNYDDNSNTGEGGRIPPRPSPRLASGPSFFRF